MDPRIYANMPPGAAADKSVLAVEQAYEVAGNIEWCSAANTLEGGTIFLTRSMERLITLHQHISSVISPLSIRRDTDHFGDGPSSDNVRVLLKG